MKNIKAFAPATIANFNVGYDVLGVALNGIGDVVELRGNNTKHNKIVAIVNGEHLPKSAAQNCCSVVIRKMQEHFGVFDGVDIHITKGFASGSGLGSSSASSAAAAFAYNELLGKPLNTKELVRFAAEGERIACGSAHIDNVAPALLGGIVLAVGKEVQDIIKLPVPDNLFATTLFPKITINTSDSRKVLPEHVSLKTASQQIGLMGAFVSSLHDNDLSRFSAVLKDLLIAPIRSAFIPKYEEMQNAVFQHHGLAFGISGSGPSVFAISQGYENAQLIAQALENVYDHVDIETQSSVHALSETSGAQIIPSSL